MRRARCALTLVAGMISLVMLMSVPALAQGARPVDDEPPMSGSCDAPKTVKVGKFLTYAITHTDMDSWIRFEEGKGWVPFLMADYQCTAEAIRVESFSQGPTITVRSYNNGTFIQDVSGYASNVAGIYYDRWRIVNQRQSTDILKDPNLEPLTQVVNVENP